MFGRSLATVAGGQMHVQSSGVVWGGRRHSQRQVISPVPRLEIRYKAFTIDPEWPIGAYKSSVEHRYCAGALFEHLRIMFTQAVTKPDMQR